MSSTFKLCPTYFSRGGEKYCRGGFAPPALPWLRAWLLASNAMKISVIQWTQEKGQISRYSIGYSTSEPSALGYTILKHYTSGSQPFCLGFRYPYRKEVKYAAPNGEPITIRFKVWWQFENVFLMMCWKNVLARGTLGYYKWHPGWETLHYADHGSRKVIESMKVTQIPQLWWHDT